MFMQFNANQGFVKMIELIDKSKSLIWKLTISVVTVILAWRMPELIIAIRVW